MARYKYTATNPEGETVTAGVEAASRDSAEAILRARGMEIHQVGRDYGELFNFRGQLKVTDVVLFSRQFASLLDAGIPLNEALTILYQQLDHKRMKEVVYDLRLEVSQGRQLSDAMSRHRSVFPPIFIAMIQAGEAQGNLVEAMEHVSTHMESQERLRKRVKGMLIYPVTVLFGLIATVAFMLYFVMPNFELLFEDDMELPMITDVMFTASAILRDSPWLVLAAAGGLAGIIMFLSKTTLFSLIKDRWGVRIPVIGPIIQKAAIARFARTLSASISSGVSLLEAFDLCAETAGNRVISKAIRDVRDRVQQGQQVSPALKATGYFPPMAVSLVAVGQESGRLDAMLEKISEEFEEQVDQQVDIAMELLKPAIIVILGGVVALVLIGIYGPMWQAIASASEAAF